MACGPGPETCLHLDASAEDGPVEFLCWPCKESRRQRRMTGELETIFADLRETRLDETTVVELSEIVGCGREEAHALLGEHRGET